MESLYSVGKLNDPDFSVRLSVSEMEELRDSVESGSRIIARGVVAAGLIGSATAGLFLKDVPLLFGFPAISVLGFALAGLLLLRR